MEFHVSRQARDRYQFNETVFALNGNVIFANFQAARQFAQKINQKRDLVNFPEQAVQAGDINAMGLIDEILHVVVALYRQKRNPQAMQKALSWVKERLGDQEVMRALELFAAEFPPVAVYRGEITLEEYFRGSTDGMPNNQVVLEEMLMLWVANKNPAFALCEELFSDARLSQESVYSPLMAELYRFFDTQPTFGPENQNLVDLLRSPAIAFPNSLYSQLGYIRDLWADLLGEFFSRFLTGCLPAWT